MNTGVRHWWNYSKRFGNYLDYQENLLVFVLGRPYHKDPGINHEIVTEFPKTAYPILAQDILPIDERRVVF